MDKAEKALSTRMNLLLDKGKNKIINNANKNFNLAKNAVQQIDDIINKLEATTTDPYDMTVFSLNLDIETAETQMNNAINYSNSVASDLYKIRNEIAVQKHLDRNKEIKK